MSDAKIYEKLSRIQDGLRVPKSKHNEFGNYNYRNAEDIEAAVKPLCLANRCTVFVSDELVPSESANIKGYIKATATLTDWDTGCAIQSSAYAAEPLSRKGMDDSQITGAASSYARKYALSGLFAVDNEKDADSMKPPTSKATQTARTTPPTPQKSPKNPHLAGFATLAKQGEALTGLTVKELADKVSARLGKPLSEVASNDEAGNAEAVLQEIIDVWKSNE
jgi:hypothetical protein